MTTPIRRESPRTSFGALNLIFALIVGSASLPAQSPITFYLSPDIDISLGELAVSDNMIVVDLGGGNYARAAFGSESDGLRVSLGRFGRVRLISNLSGTLARVAAVEPAAAAREFLSAHPVLFGGQTAALEVVGEHRFGPMTQVRFRQLAAGIPVWGGDTVVTLGFTGEVVQVQAGEAVSSRESTGQSNLSAADAAATAAKIARVAGFERAILTTGPSSRSVYFENPTFPGDPIIVQTVAFPETLTSAIPAFRVFVTASKTASYELLISAVDAALLFRANLVSKMAQARVWKKPPIAGGSSQIPYDIAALWRILAARSLGFSATGIDGNASTQVVTVNAAFDMPPTQGANQNPQVNGLPSGLVEYLAQFSYQIDAQDPDGDALSFKLLDGPAGMSVTETGLVQWLATQFSIPRAKIEIADGNGGRVLHNFTLPVTAVLEPGVPVEISSFQNQPGRAVFTLPEGANVAQIRLRSEDEMGDADMVVFGPLGQFGLSIRDGSNETLAFAQPSVGEWEVTVNSFFDYQNVRLSIELPEPTELEPDKAHGPFGDVTSSQTYYKFVVPDGIDSVTVTAGQGSGDADVYLAKDIATFVAAVDLNDDGRTDLAVPNLTNNSVSVFPAAGGGTFQTRASYGAEMFPSKLTVGDFNGDGEPDLAVANSAANSVGVLLGAGAGRFQMDQTYKVTGTPTSVGTADFNRDGLADIFVKIVLDNNGAPTSSIEVLLGTCGKKPTTSGTSEPWPRQAGCMQSGK